MKFTEIKDKIQNLGNFKSLPEIKKVGLRICRNTKTGDYWLIEEEFLKPVFRSPRESNSIMIDRDKLKFNIFYCNQGKEELLKKKALDYIKWGERQKINQNPTCINRKYWWSIEGKLAQIFVQMSFNDILRFFYSSEPIFADARLYTIIPNLKILQSNLAVILNSTLSYLFVEMGGRINLGEGALDFKVYEAADILNPSAYWESKTERIEPNTILIKHVSEEIRFLINKNRLSNSIFKEIGINPNQSIREQQPNPLPDRKALDDIVFNALGLTDEERKEVYWAVAELVKNRLEKAKNV